jgi:hypothetical protein
MKAIQGQPWEAANREVARTHQSRSHEEGGRRIRIYFFSEVSCTASRRDPAQLLLAQVGTPSLGKIHWVSTM